MLEARLREVNIFDEFHIPRLLLKNVGQLHCDVFPPLPRQSPREVGGGGVHMPAALVGLAKLLAGLERRGGVPTSRILGVARRQC